MRLNSHMVDVLIRKRCQECPTQVQPCEDRERRAAVCKPGEEVSGETRPPTPGLGFQVLKNSEGMNTCCQATWSVAFDDGSQCTHADVSSQLLANLWFFLGPSLLFCIEHLGQAVNTVSVFFSVNKRSAVP